MPVSWLTDLTAWDGGILKVKGPSWPEIWHLQNCCWYVASKVNLISSRARAECSEATLFWFQGLKKGNFKNKILFFSFFNSLNQSYPDCFFKNDKQKRRFIRVIVEKQNKYSTTLALAHFADRLSKKAYAFVHLRLQYISQFFHEKAKYTF